MQGIIPHRKPTSAHRIGGERATIAPLSHSTILRMVGELSMPAKCGIGHALWSCCWACTPIATNASRRSWAQLVGFAGLHVHDMAVMLSTKRLCGVHDMIYFHYASASGCRQLLTLRSQRAVENAILINIVLAAHVYVGGRWPKCVGRLAAGR